MATTYEGTQLDTSPLFRARFLLGDTGALRDGDGEKAYLLQDEEITSMLAMFGFQEGAAQCADGLISRVSQEPTKYKDEGGVDVDFSARITTWRDLAKRLRSGTVQTADQKPVSGTPMLAITTGPDMGRLR